MDHVGFTGARMEPFFSRTGDSGVGVLVDVCSRCNYHGSNELWPIIVKRSFVQVFLLQSYHQTTFFH